MRHLITLYRIALISFVIVLFSVCFTFAKSLPTVEISSCSAVSDEIIKISVSIKNNPGLSGLDLAIEYDTDAFELIKTEDSQLFKGGIFSDENVDLSVSPHHLVWSVEDSNDENGIIAYLSFKVLKSAESKNYSISVDYDESEMLNYYLNNVLFSSTDGIVSVQSYYIDVLKSFKGISLNDTLILAKYDSNNRLRGIKFVNYSSATRFLYWKDFVDKNTEQVKCFALNGGFICIDKNISLF